MLMLRNWFIYICHFLFLNKYHEYHACVTLCVNVNVNLYMNACMCACIDIFICVCAYAGSVNGCLRLGACFHLCMFIAYAMKSICSVNM